MEGASMQQAKAALLLALDNLQPSDKFNIIDFDSEARPLFTESSAADGPSIAAAQQFVGTITADGGTEMMSALRIALPEEANTPSGTVRQGSFMTHRQGGNEQRSFSFLPSPPGGIA